MKFKISSPQSIGDLLKNAVQGIVSGLDSQLDAHMAKVSQQAFDKAKELAAVRLHRTKQEYIDALTLERVSDSVYVVRLDGSAAHLEEGYDRYDMKPGLLKLGTGADGLVTYNHGIGAGGNGSKGGVKVSKEGYRYRVIPMDDHSSAPMKPSHPLNQAQMRIGKPDQRSLGDFAAQFDALKKTANKMAKGRIPDGFKGRAWTVTQDPINKHFAQIKFGDGSKERVNLNREFNTHHNGLTNMRAPKENGGKGSRSAYVTFRVVSEKQVDKWWNPGFAGAHVIPDVQKWTEDTFANMVDAIFRQAG